MPRGLTLHIGTPKSGTTHLQAVLQAARDRLNRLDVCYPGAASLPRKGFNQQPAIYALAGPSIGWIDDTVRANGHRHLSSIAAELAGHPGRALVSAESLAFFDADAGRALLDRLGYEASAVTVVVTARDLGRLLPSIWQQNVKNGSTQALTPYLESVAAQRDRPDIPLWTAFGLPALVRRWADVVGMDRVVLVTAPQRADAPDALWRRFAEAVDLPADLFDAAQGRELSVDNLSLTPSQAELIRQLNLLLHEEGRPRAEQQVLRGRLLQIWMNRPPALRRRLVVPTHLQDEVRQWAAEDALLLAGSGVRVVGSLSDLEPEFRPGAEPETDHVIDADTARDVLTLIEDGVLAAAATRTARPRWRSWIDPRDWIDLRDGPARSRSGT